MTFHHPQALAASILIVCSGVLWGFYWLPVRHLETLGIAGPWGTAGIALAAVLSLLPIAWLRRQDLKRAHIGTLAALLLGGAAFALYSIGFVYGRVALIILLFFLTPVWSTLIARFVMGWHTPAQRIAAIVVGLSGLGLMLGAQGELPLPRTLGEWMALMSGVMWAVSSTILRTQPALAPGPASFVFALGAMLMALTCAVALEPMPNSVSLPQFATALAGGIVWWGAAIAALMWATVRLEPARVGILLMSEVLVGAASAALLAGEHLATPELLGGVLVLAAGVLEVWPSRRTPQSFLKVRKP